MSLEEELRKRFLLQGIATGPAKPDSVDALEQQLGHPLPAAYRAYLRVCGTHPPVSLIGSDCTIGRVPSNTEYALELFHENNIDPPKKTFVAFLMQQGYFFDYFLIDGSDDPAVYSYMEGDPEVKQSARRFSEWVAAIPGHMAT